MSRLPGWLSCADVRHANLSAAGESPDAGALVAEEGQSEAESLEPAVPSLDGGLIPESDEVGFDLVKAGERPGAGVQDRARMQAPFELRGQFIRLLGSLRSWKRGRTLPGWLEDTRASYDTVAASYADLTRHLLDERPQERAVLALFADMVHAQGGGTVADVGCGPGRITAHLRQLGVDAFGIDLSPAMIQVARRDHPGLRFDLGSMTDLALPDASITGLVAWSSLIHIPDDEISSVFAHFQRVLRPGGPLLLSFHLGDEPQLKTHGYGGHPMKVHVHRRRHDQMAAWLNDAGFAVETHTTLTSAEQCSGVPSGARQDHSGGPGIMEMMSNSRSRRFPVTVTQLPVTRCQICHRTVAYRPGNLSEVLTEHYRRAHPQALAVLSR